MRILPLMLPVALLAGCGGGDVSVRAEPSTTTTPPVSVSPALPASPSSMPTTSGSPTMSASMSPSPTPTLSQTPSPTPSTPTLGTTQTGPLGAVTVYSVVTPVSGGRAADIRTPGMQFAVADIKLCASETTDEYSALDWHLKDKEDRAYSFFNTQVGARSPDLSDVSAVSGGSCSRGWLTFEVPRGTKVTEIEYAPIDGEPLIWRVGKPS